MKKSVYKYAAEAGLPVGIYLTAMSACLLLSLRIESLPVLMLLLALGFPFLLAYYMRRMSLLEPAYSKISALWLCGIYSVIFGTLICSLLSGIYLTVIDPGFIHAYVENALMEIESSPVAGEYAATTEMMRRAIDGRMLPGGMQFVASMGWLTCFVGSMLSLVLAVVIGRRRQHAAEKRNVFGG